MRILGIPHNADGSGYYRVYQPLAQLGRHDHEVTLPPHGTHILPYQFWLDELDVIVGQRLGGSVGSSLWQSWARSCRGKLVYEVDDDVFAADNPLDINAGTREGVAACAALADMVTVSTEPLAERMRQFNPNVVVLPNHIHADLLTLDRPRRDRVTVGWAGGTSHQADLASVAPHLRRFADRNPDVDLHLIGADYSPLVHPRCRFTPWTPDVWDYYAGIDFDIGLAPLVSSEFNRSKSALKALEYAALGIPVVASDEPPYRDFVIDGVTGYRVRREHEWGRRLYELANDEAMRTEMGAKARKHAAAWTIQAGWRSWESAYAA